MKKQQAIRNLLTAVILAVVGVGIGLAAVYSQLVVALPR